MLNSSENRYQRPQKPNLKEAFMISMTTTIHDQGYIFVLTNCNMSQFLKPGNFSRYSKFQRVLTFLLVGKNFLSATQN